MISTTGELPWLGASAGALAAVGEGAGYGEEGVVGFGVADADPGAFTGEGADGDADRLAGGGERYRVLAEPEPDEVGLGGRHGPAVGEQRLAGPGPLLDRELDAFEQLGLSGQGGEGR